jgi:hypothetical protein
VPENDKCARARILGLDPGDADGAVVQDPADPGQSVRNVRREQDEPDVPVRPLGKVFFRDAAALTELRVVLPAELPVPYALALGSSPHELVAPLAVTRPPTVRLVYPSGAQRSSAPEYQFEWSADPGDARLIRLLFEHWPASSVSDLLDAHTSDAVAVYPEMPVLVYGRLHARGNQNERPVHLWAEEGRRKVTLAGVDAIGQDWPGALLKQRVYALAIVTILRPLVLRVGILAF